MRKYCANKPRFSWSRFLGHLVLLGITEAIPVYEQIQYAFMVFERDCVTFPVVLVIEILSRKTSFIVNDNSLICGRK